MKPSRLNKVIGLAIGETSLTAAEVVAGEKPTSDRLAEFVYPEGITPTQPAAFGAALATFLKENDFTAKQAVIGIPARWLVVKPKEIPPTDPNTLAELLRLQAEGEFSSELKDLVYDYAGGGDSTVSRSVLLIATSKKYVDAVVQICDAARLEPLAVMPSAIALSTAAATVSENAMVLTVGAGSAELTAQSAGATSDIRHLRGPGPERSFIGELRRAVSSFPSNGAPREMVLWDSSGLDAASLGDSLGIKVRSVDLPILGVDAAQSGRNGDGRRYAAAVALGLAALSTDPLTVDFLHSRLAPPKPQRIPKWATAAGLGGILLIILIVLAYSDLNSQQSKLDTLNNTIAGKRDLISAAELFVAKVSVAQAWHGGNPRYLACLKDITNAIPDDNQTFATNLHLNETAKPPTPVGAPKTVEIRTLTGQLTGKTTDQQKVQAIIDLMKKNPAFIDVKNGGSSSESGRTREVSFSINFVYRPSNGTP